jgi:hypothetical protein
MQKTKPNSKEVVRTCEKCNQHTLLLTQEVTGKTSVNIVIKYDEGVVAERWSCQNCDNFFQLSLDSPNPLKMWFVMALIPLIIGLMGVVISILQMVNILPKPSNFLFTFIYCVILFAVGCVGSKYAYYRKNILKRNPVIDGVIPVPMNERKENLPYDRRPRLCSCGLKMNCVSDVTRSFNMLPTGVEYGFKCESNNLNSNLVLNACNKEIKIESTWRSILFAGVSVILFLILNFIYNEGITGTLSWIFFTIGIIVAIYLLVIRSYKIYYQFKYKRISL